MPVNPLRKKTQYVAVTRYPPRVSLDQQLESMNREPDRAWLIRGVILGLVLALHISGMVFLWTLTVTGIHPPYRSNTSHALQVRFIEVYAPPLTVPWQATRSLKPVVGASSHRKRRANPTVRHPPPTPARGPQSPSAADTLVRLSLLSAMTTNRDQNYIPGGGLLNGGSSMTWPNVRLPAAQAVKGAPHFRMVDARIQGLAGVVHFIGALTGAVDRHCLDLEAWEGMTQQDRIKYHVSLDVLEKTRDSYRCQPPPERNLWRE